MPYRDATICAKGHVLSETQMNSQPRCDKCGAEAISCCPHCQSVFRGKKYSDGLVGPGKKIVFPYYCYSCGKPLPWTETLIENAIELLSLDIELDNAAKTAIRASIPDLIVESISTPVATAKFKKQLDRTGEATKNLIYQLFVDVVSSAISTALFK